jgi:prophage regulatory protein
MTDERPQAVSFAELKTDYGIRFSSRWIRELCKAGQFPKPLRLTANRVAWLKSEVEDWLADKAAQRNQPVAAAANAPTRLLETGQGSSTPKPVAPVRARQGSLPRRLINGGGK